MSVPSQSPNPWDSNPSDSAEGNAQGSGSQAGEEPWTPRPNDFLVEPMFAPFERGEPKAQEGGGGPELTGEISTGEASTGAGPRRAQPWWRRWLDRLGVLGSQSDPMDSER